MKKSMFLRFALALAILLCLIGLTSCATPLDRLAELDEAARIDALLAPVNSEAPASTLTDGPYEMTVTTDITMKADGGFLDTHGVVRMLKTARDDKNPAHLNTMHSTSTLTDRNGEVTEAKLDASFGYLDGKVFSTYQKDGGETTVLWQNATVDVYREYAAENGMGSLFSSGGAEDEEPFSLSAEDCSDISCTVDREAQTATLTMSGFPKPKQHELLLALGDDIEDAVDVTDVEDIFIRITLDSQLRISKFELIFTFADEGSDISAFSTVVDIRYEDIVFDAEISFSEGTEVEDILLKPSLRRAIGKIRGANTGKFEVASYTYTTFGGQVLSQGSTQESVSFIYDADGKYSYTVEGMYPGEQRLTTYKDNGFQYVYVTANNRTTQYMYPQDRLEATQYIMGLCDPAKLLTASLGDIEAVSAIAGQYKIAVNNPDVSAFKDTVNSVNGTIKDKEAYIIVTYAGGELISYEYYFTFSIAIPRQDEPLKVSLAAYVVYS